jgi:hypothetical protein
MHIQTTHKPPHKRSKLSRVSRPHPRATSPQKTNVKSAKTMKNRVKVKIQIYTKSSTMTTKVKQTMATVNAIVMTMYAMLLNKLNVSYLANLAIRSRKQLQKRYKEIYSLSNQSTNNATLSLRKRQSNCTLSM